MRDKRDEIKLRLLLESEDIDPYALLDEDRQRILEIDRELEAFCLSRYIIIS
jgi:hypothetical protein